MQEDNKVKETTVYVDWLVGMQKAAEALASKLEGTEHREDADRLAEEFAEKLDNATLRAFSDALTKALDRCIKEHGYNADAINGALERLEAYITSVSDAHAGVPSED